MGDSTVRICPNPNCRLVMPHTGDLGDNVNILIYPRSDKYCPRCNTPWKARPPWKGPPGYDEVGDKEEGEGSWT